MALEPEVSSQGEVTTPELEAIAAHGLLSPLGKELPGVVDSVGTFQTEPFLWQGNHSTWLVLKILKLQRRRALRVRLLQ